MESQAPDVKKLPDNIRYEIARQNIAMQIEEIKTECGLTDLMTMSVLESILGTIKGNFNTSAAFQAAQFYGGNTETLQAVQ